MKTIKISLLVLSVLMLFSCKREDELRNMGVTYKVVESLTSDVSTIDAQQGGKIVFKAKFDSPVKWELKIVGRQSTITKTMIGFSSELNSSNATWDGGADKPGFIPEMCDAYLTVPGHTDTMPTVVQVISAKDYSKNCVLVADFSSKSKYIYDAGYSEPKEVLFKGIVADKMGGYFEFTGSDVSANWIIGTAKFINPVNATPQATELFNISTTNQDEVYFNVFVYGNGQAYTNINFDFQECDNGHAGLYSDTKDDTWSYGSIIPNWTGWKLVSFKLSECTRSTQAIYGGSGNGKQEVNHIKNVQLVLGSTKPNVNASAVIGFAAFTVGKPFEL